MFNKVLKRLFFSRDFSWNFSKGLFHIFSKGFFPMDKYSEFKLSLLCSHLIIFARKEVLKGSMRKIIWNLDCTEKSFGKWCGKYNSCNSFAASYYLAIVANNMVVVCNK